MPWTEYLCKEEFIKIMDTTRIPIVRIRDNWNSNVYILSTMASRI